MGLYKYLKFKLWFIFDLPQFVKQQNYKMGVELGAKGCRSMKRVLRMNPQLTMIGIDLWELIPGGAYKKNVQNEDVCKEALKMYGSRAILYKGDVNEQVHKVENSSLDFVFYDLNNCSLDSTMAFHEKVIRHWIPKVKKGGFFIGRAFHTPDLGGAIKKIGCPVKKCVIEGRESERLMYFEV